MESQPLVTLGFLLIVTITLGGTYLRARATGHPIHPTALIPPQHKAEREARRIAERLLGYSLRKWTSYCALVRDEEALDSLTLHHGDGIDTELLIERWGLSGEWRIQFIESFILGQRSVLVGLNVRNELVLFNATGENDAPCHESSGSRASADSVLRQLTSVGSHWNAVSTVADTVDRSSGTGTVLTHVKDEAGPVVVAATITSIRGRITQVDRRVHTAEARTSLQQHRQARHDLVGAGAVLMSVGSVIAGVVILATTNLTPNLGLAAGLGLTVFCLNLINDSLSVQSSVVAAYNPHIPLRLFRLITVVTLITMSALYGTVVFVGSAAATVLAASLDVDVLAHPDEQFFIGVVVASAWLAFSACYGAALHRLDLGRLSRSPNAQFIRRAGVPWTRSLIGGMTSSLSEETVYRFLALLLLLNLTGNQWGSIAISALLWALMHGGQVTDPPIYRLIELFIVGSALGFLLLHVGLIAVVVAHAGFNIVVLRSHSQVPHPRAQVRI